MRRSGPTRARAGARFAVGGGAGAAILAPSLASRRVVETVNSSAAVVDPGGANIAEAGAVMFNVALTAEQSHGSFAALLAAGFGGKLRPASRLPAPATFPENDLQLPAAPSETLNNHTAVGAHMEVVWLASTGSEISEEEGPNSAKFGLGSASARDGGRGMRGGGASASQSPAAGRKPDAVATPSIRFDPAVSRAAATARADPALALRYTLRAVADDGCCFSEWTTNALRSGCLAFSAPTSCVFFGAAAAAARASTTSPHSSPRMPQLVLLPSAASGRLRITGVRHMYELRSEIAHGSSLVTKPISLVGAPTDAATAIDTYTWSEIIVSGSDGGGLLGLAAAPSPLTQVALPPTSATTTALVCDEGGAMAVCNTLDAALAGNDAACDSLGLYLLAAAEATASASASVGDEQAARTARASAAALLDELRELRAEGSGTTDADFAAALQLATQTTAVGRDAVVSTVSASPPPPPLLPTTLAAPTAIAPARKRARQGLAPATTLRARLSEALAPLGPTRLVQTQVVGALGPPADAQPGVPFAVPLAAGLDWHELVWAPGGVLVRGVYYALEAMAWRPHTPARAAV